jgi:hypothetical protein
LPRSTPRYKIKDDAGDTDHLEHLRLAAKRLRELVTAVGPHLATAGWHRCRDIIRTLAQRIEIGREVIKIVFRVTTEVRNSGPSPLLLRYRGCEGVRLRTCAGTSTPELSEGWARSSQAENS